MFFLIFLPVVSIIAYLIVKVLPELRHSYRVGQAGTALQDRINPSRHIKDLERLLQVQNTPHNRKQLAMVYSQAGCFAKSRELLRQLNEGFLESMQNQGRLNRRLLLFIALQL
jgi:hypothetical protein